MKKASLCLFLLFLTGCSSQVSVETEKESIYEISTDHSETTLPDITFTYQPKGYILNFIEPETTQKETEETTGIPETVPETTQTNSYTSSNPPTSPSSSNKGSSVSSGRTVSANYQARIYEPSQEVFGKYYDYAIQVYNYANTGQKVSLLDFDTEDEMNTFLEQVRTTMFQDSKVNSLSGYSFAYTTTDSKVHMQPMNIGYEEFQEKRGLDSFIVSICGNGISEKQMIDSLNNWLISNTNYDYSFQEDSYEYWGVYYNHSAVCNGYARFVEYACDLYEIPCEVIIGNSGDHAWNRVQIGGTWYYLDTTWNVTTKSNSYGLSTSLWEGHYMSNTPT